jgi:CHAD domain-containing protein
MPTEIEDKYDVDELFTLPDLTGVGPIASVGEPREESLEALYFDTADLRLATGHATLRRRLGGHDEGWHLKLAIAPGVRTEIHRPAGKSARTPPVALRRLVRALTRTSTLEPVARLRTARTIRELRDADGEVLAEVCDDRVTAEELGSTAVVSSWRELEVELVDGGEKVLAVVGPKLTKAGARPAAYPSKLARVLGGRLRARQPAPPEGDAGAVIWAAVREQIDALKAYDPRVQSNEPDSVHKMRVAARKLRSLLAAYRPLFDREVTEPIRAELKWLGGVLGTARDAEVMGDRLIDEVHKLPDELVLGPVASRITSEQTSRYRDAHAAVLTELAGDRYLELLDRLDELVRTPPLTDKASKPAKKVMPDRVRHAWRRVGRAVDGAHQPDAELDVALHEVRKAAKRARYAATAAGADSFAKRMKKVQSVLGDHQDSVQARVALREAGVRAHLAGENGFTYGLLYNNEAQNAARSRRKFDDVWQRLGNKY